MAWAKQIKGKIKSVSNIKKMTKALEIVSTIKLQKLKTKTEKYRDFLIEFLKIAQVIHSQVNLFQQEENQNKEKEAKKNLLIVVSTDKWLCGPVNSKLFKQLSLKYDWDFENTEIFCVGRKSKEFFERNNVNIVWNISIKDNFSEKDLEQLQTYLQSTIKNWEYQNIEICFNYFKNTISQVPVILNLYPFNKQEIEQFIKQVWNIDLDNYLWGNIKNKEITFEPSLNVLRKEFIQQFINHIVYWAVLQNKTWEFASRMIAMKNAKDNAWDIQKKLTLQFNKIRQWAITQEISEIVWAKIAME